MLTARRAQKSDVAQITALIGQRHNDCVTRYGAYDIPHLIETSILGISVVDMDDNIVAFASFLDAVPEGHQLGNLEADRWPQWLETNFQQDGFVVENTVWMSFFVSHADVERDAADRMLQTAFSTLPNLEGILALLPLEVRPFMPLKTMFEPLTRIDPAYQGAMAYACPRDFFIPSLSIRRARIEDHDDLVPIFDEQSEVLTSIYGEFFLAELIETRTEHTHSLVAEVNGRAVGLMSLTDEIDTRLLQDCFDLELYDNLQKPVDEAEVQRKAEERAQRAARKPKSVLRQEAVFAALAAASPVRPDLVSGFLHNFASVLDAAADVEGLPLPEAAAAAVGAFEAAATAAGEAIPDYLAFVQHLHAFAAALGLALDGRKQPDGRPPTLRLEVSLLTYLEYNVLDGGAKIDLVPDVIKTIKITDAPLPADEEAEDQAGEEDEGAEQGASSDNCFSITLFCLDEGFDARGIDFLASAFDLYPDREYCLVTLPHTSEESQLLTHFTVVQPRPNNSFSHMLYILHRESHSAPISLEWVTPDHVPDVAELLEGMANAGSIINSLNESVQLQAAVDRTLLKTSGGSAADAEAARGVWLADMTMAGFVITCEGQVVGTLVLDKQDKLNTLRSDFAIEDYIALADVSSKQPTTADEPIEQQLRSCHAMANLRYFILNPLFKTKSRHVFREALRLFKKAALVYRAHTGQPLQEVTDLFVQVRPRVAPIIPDAGIVLEAASEVPAANLKDAADGIGIGVSVWGEMAKAAAAGAPQEAEQEAPFALHVLSRSLLSQPKITINSRVLVVGASDVGLSFLENLLLVADLHYTSITLLSRTGLPMGRSQPGAENGSQGQFLPWGLHYDYGRMQRLSIESRVRVIADCMVGLNCDQKTVTLSDGAVLPYDICVLTPGLQDQTRSTVVEPGSELEGIFSLNNEDDVVDFMTFVENTQPAMFVVYGCTLAALCAIRGLLDVDVPPAAIVWAHPHPEDNASWCNNNKAVLDTLLATLAKLGVTIMAQMRLVGIKQSDGKLTHVVLQATGTDGDLETEDPDDLDLDGEAEGGPAHKNETTLECHALLGCDTPDVDANIFNAMTNNSLVYDGRAVVDSALRTADPSVFAAGTFAKFSRRYGAKQLTMEAYDSHEVGQRLAESVLQFIDPASMGQVVLPANPPRLGIRPKTLEGLLPGNLNFFLSQKPAYQPVKKPEVLVTENHDNLCRLEFDDMDVLRTIIYIGTRPVQTPNLVRLLGLPASYFNRILYRYSQDEVPDLVDYLQAPWSTTLFHESFAQLRTQLNQQVDNKDAIRDITAQVMSLLQERNNGAEVDRSKLSTLVESMPAEYKQVAQLRLLQFIELHSNHLPHMQVPA